MNNSINNSFLKFGLAACLFSFSAFSFSSPSIEGADQDMSAGTVTAKWLMLTKTAGWLYTEQMNR